jgi:protein TonB
LTIRKSECEPPTLAKEKNIAGAVRLMIVVDSEGSVESIKIISGHPLLQQAAFDCAKQWKFLSTGERYWGELKAHVGKKTGGK